MKLDRPKLALALAALAILSIGLLRPDNDGSGLPRDLYWVRKISWPSRFDIVVAGDSRILIDVSPAAMREVMPELRIGNFGFEGNGFSPDYCEAIEKLIDPSSETRIIVLGITPSSLTEISIQSNNFIWLREKHTIEIQLQAQAGTLSHYFRPFEFIPLNKGIIEGGVAHIYYSDGWVACSLVPERPEWSLGDYENIFKENKVDPEIVNGLIGKVHKWKSKGISVYGFFPPTTEAMRALELRLSGIDEASFITRFQEAGGIWLHFPNGRYPSYDGSHLSDYAAVDFSKDLAGSILKSAGK